MQVVLAQAPHRDTFGYSMPPPGLLRLGGALRRAGIDVVLDDLAHALAAGELEDGDGLPLAAARRLVARVEGPRAPLIGVSVMGATVPAALAILAHAKRMRPDARTVLGGPGTTGVDAALVERFACVDFVVRGEGEETLVELVRVLERGGDARDVAGTTTRAGRAPDRPPIQDLATLAPHAWELLPPIAEYKRVTGPDDGLVAIDSGRGCVYDCSFCTIGRFWSRRSRVVPARVLADEIDALRSMPGATSAYLCHDIFGANRGHAIALCDELVRRGNATPWEVRARADHLDRELLDAMARAGCWRVLIGVESADADVRERNQKGLRRDVDLLRVVDDCARAKIVPILSLILGLPGEDDRALRKSLDFCANAALRAGVQISLHLVNPQPGCALGEEHGARARPIEGIPPDMAWGAGDTAEERAVRAAHPDLFTTWALLAGDEEELRALHGIASELPDVLMRYPRTWALLARASSCDTLDLFRAWKHDGRSFETFARAQREPADGRVLDALAWEQAIARVQARGERDVATRGPVFDGEVVELAHDVSALATDVATMQVPERATWLVVQATRRGVRTSRVGRDVARLIHRFDGSRTRAELESAELAALCDRWCSEGLLEDANGH